MVEISVLIPTYLRPDMLRRSVDSVLAQQRVEAPFEIVVVDNDPNESARPTVAEMAAGAAVPIRYVAEPRPGISHARNTAVASAAGRYIAWLARSKYFKQKQDQYDCQNQAQSAAAVVSQPRTCAVAAISKSENQHNEDNDQKHSYLLL